MKVIRNIFVVAFTLTVAVGFANGFDKKGQRETWS